MKRVIVVALLASAAISAHATDAQQTAICESLADTAGVFAKARDNGQSLMDVKRQIGQAHLRSDITELFESTATRVFMGSDYADLTVNQVRSHQYVQCLGWNIAAK